MYRIRRALTGQLHQQGVIGGLITAVVSEKDLKLEIRAHSLWREERWKGGDVGGVEC